MNIGIIGYTGKMGRALLEIAKKDNLKISVVYSREIMPIVDIQLDPQIHVTTKYSQLIEMCDVVIDFSRPESTLKVIKHCIEQNRPIVSGTTGFTSDEMDQIIKAGEHTKVFYSANMSLGIAILSHIMKQAATLFMKNSVEIDIAILERHHKHKADKPSGTAMMLANSLNKTFNHMLHPEIASLRYGTTIGEHEVTIASDFEALTLTHHAINRCIFAIGAVCATKFLLNQQNNGFNK